MSQTPHHSPYTNTTQWSHLQTQGPREAPEAVLLSWSPVLALCLGSSMSCLELSSISSLQVLIW